MVASHASPLRLEVPDACSCQGSSHCGQRERCRPDLRWGEDAQLARASISACSVFVFPVPGGPCRQAGQILLDAHSIIKCGLPGRGVCCKQVRRRSGQHSSPDKEHCSHEKRFHCSTSKRPDLPEGEGGDHGQGDGLLLAGVQAAALRDVTHLRAQVHPPAAVAASAQHSFSTCCMGNDWCWLTFTCVRRSIRQLWSLQHHRTASA